MQCAKEAQKSSDKSARVTVAEQPPMPQALARNSTGPTKVCRDFTCSKCRGFGHVAKQCPSWLPTWAWLLRESLRNSNSAATQSCSNRTENCSKVQQVTLSAEKSTTDISRESLQSNETCKKVHHSYCCESQGPALRGCMSSMYIARSTSVPDRRKKKEEEDEDEGEVEAMSSVLSLLETEKAIQKKDETQC